MTAAPCGTIPPSWPYTAPVDDERTCVLCERTGTRGFDVYIDDGHTVTWCCDNRDACQRRQDAIDAESDTWTVADAAEYLNVAVKSADGQLRRWRIAAVGRDAGRGGSNRYPASKIKRAHRTRPGQGWAAHLRLVDQPVSAHVAYATHPRQTHTDASQSGYHAVLDQPLQVGRLSRAAGDALCKPADKFAGLVDSHGEITCPRCQELVDRLHVTVGES